MLKVHTKYLLQKLQGLKSLHSDFPVKTLTNPANICSVSFLKSTFVQYFFFQNILTIHYQHHIKKKFVEIYSLTHIFGFFEWCAGRPANPFKKLLEQ